MKSMRLPAAHVHVVLLARGWQEAGGCLLGMRKERDTLPSGETGELEPASACLERSLLPCCSPTQGALVPGSGSHL